MADREPLTPERLFAWAVTRDGPTLREAAAAFRCTQADIEEAIDAADLPQGQYLGLVVAKQSALGIAELHRGEREIEAYYG